MLQNVISLEGKVDSKTLYAEHIDKADIHSIETPCRQVGLCNDLGELHDADRATTHINNCITYLPKNYIYVNTILDAIAEKNSFKFCLDNK